MTTDPNAPDAALLWAREFEASVHPSTMIASMIRQGACDEYASVRHAAEAFRAGQAHADAGLLDELERLRAEVAQLKSVVYAATQAQTDHKFLLKETDAMPFFAAVKHFRGKSGLSLLEAKCAVERHRAALGEQP